MKYNTAQRHFAGSALCLQYPFFLVFHPKAQVDHVQSFEIAGSLSWDVWSYWRGIFQVSLLDSFQAAVQQGREPAVVSAIAAKARDVFWNLEVGAENVP